MATIEKFEDIEAWQMARVLSKEIFNLSKTGDLSRDFKLRDQIRNSTSSIMDNIAEGFERDGNKELIQFLSISKASAGEARSQLYQALDRAYITGGSSMSFTNLCQRSVVCYIIGSNI